jgi:hypothetical protein
LLLLRPTFETGIFLLGSELNSSLAQKTAHRSKFCVTINISTPAIDTILYQ